MAWLEGRPRPGEVVLRAFFPLRSSGSKGPRYGGGRFPRVGLRYGGQGSTHGGPHRRGVAALGAEVPRGLSGHGGAGGRGGGLRGGGGAGGLGGGGFGLPRLEPGHGLRTGPGPQALVRAHPRAQGAPRPAHGPGDGEAPQGGEGRGGLRRGVRGVVRRGGEAGLRGDGPLPVSPQADPGALRARGAGLRHHPLELPRGHGDPQGGPGLGGGVHLRAEARGGEPLTALYLAKLFLEAGAPLGSSRSSPPPGPPRSPAPSWRTKGSASSPSRGAPRWG